MRVITFKDVVQEYPTPNGSEVIRVLDEISLEIDKPSITVLLGPSGCGKSTLMRMAGGVRPFNVKTPTSGEILIDGEPCSGFRADTITVFQAYANFPNLSVRDNVSLPFRLKHWKDRIPKEEQEERIAWALDRVGLTDRANNRPAQLSGGQNQRVALAQALVLQPRILLMDEPFGALDAQTRTEMQELLINLWKERENYILFITHDVEEALLLADRIIVLSTKPARISLDIDLIQEKPRSDLWLNSTRIRKVEKNILTCLAEG